MDNSECFGVKFVKIYPEMTSQYFLKKIWFWLITKDYFRWVKVPGTTLY